MNRFSKDIGFLDDLLPYIFCEYLLVTSQPPCSMISPALLKFCVYVIQLLLRCIAVIATAISSNPWVAIPAVVLIISFLAIRWYYLRTSREVKRLEAIGESHGYINKMTVPILVCTY